MHKTLVHALLFKINDKKVIIPPQPCTLQMLYFTSGLYCRRSTKLCFILRQIYQCMLVHSQPLAQNFHHGNLRYDSNNYQEIVLHMTGSKFCICTWQEVNSAFARAVNIKVDWGKGTRNVLRAEDLREKGSRPKGARDHIQQIKHVQLEVIGKFSVEDFMIDIVGTIKLHFKLVPKTSHIRI